MKNLVLTFVVVMICIVGFKFANAKDKTTNFTITADTNISKNPQLSKYVTQEEIDNFSFRYWDIAEEADHEDENETQKALRHLLEARQTDKVLEFLKDNNLLADTKLQANTTPLMYSAFYNDENTTKELIKLGANIRAKDNYKLSPMAYAIENNATKVVKILFDNGVKFDEVEMLQHYKHPKFIHNIFIDKNHNATLKTTILSNKNKVKPQDFLFDYIVVNDYTELAKIVLESGFKPKAYTNSRQMYATDDIKEFYNHFNVKNGRSENEDYFAFSHSIYNKIQSEKMLKLLLDYNISGQPTQKFMKEVYDIDCVNGYKFYIQKKYYYLYNSTYGIDGDKEEKILKQYQEIYKKKHNKLYARSERFLEILIKDGIIQRKPFIPDSDEIRFYDNKIDFYGKYCGEKDFDIQKLMDWHDKPKGQISETYFAWENKPIDKNATFYNIEEFMKFWKQLYPEKEIKFNNIFFVDSNMTYEDYISIKIQNITNETELNKLQNKLKNKKISIYELNLQGEKYGI